jgi:hypothetical protein
LWVFSYTADAGGAPAVGRRVGKPCGVRANAGTVPVLPPITAAAFGKSIPLNPLLAAFPSDAAGRRAVRNTHSSLRTSHYSEAHISSHWIYLKDSLAQA